MVSKKEVEKFVESQKSLQFYTKMKTALRDVLLKIPDKDYRFVTKNLIIVCVHEGILGQVMHFPKRDKFRVMQLIFPKKAPVSVLRFVLAHELGHVLQDRNWKDGDGMKLEEDADKTAERWGFKKTKSIEKWMDDYYKKFN